MAIQLNLANTYGMLTPFLTSAPGPKVLGTCEPPDLHSAHYWVSSNPPGIQLFKNIVRPHCNISIREE